MISTNFYLVQVNLSVKILHPVLHLNSIHIRLNSVLTSSSVMLEYSSPSGIGPRAGGGAETAPLNGLPLPLQDADVDTGGDGEAS